MILAETQVRFAEATDTHAHPWVQHPSDDCEVLVHPWAFGDMCMRQ